MVRKNSKYLYSAVSIPKDTMDEIDNWRKVHATAQYRSRAEFIMEAIRQKLEQPHAPSSRELQRLSEKDRDLYFKNLIGEENFNLIKSGSITWEDWVKDSMGILIDPKTKELAKFGDPSIKKQSDPQILQSIEKRLSTIEKKLKKH